MAGNGLFQKRNGITESIASETNSLQGEIAEMTYNPRNRVETEALGFASLTLAYETPSLLAPAMVVGNEADESGLSTAVQRRRTAEAL
jgi:hypothetical protein